MLIIKIGKTVDSVKWLRGITNHSLNVLGLSVMVCVEGFADAFFDRRYEMVNGRRLFLSISESELRAIKLELIALGFTDVHLSARANEVIRYSASGIFANYEIIDNCLCIYGCESETAP